MRLIDADKLIEDLEKVKKESESLVDISHIIGFQSVIDAQPTAFDVDKVVEHLEVLREKAQKRREELIGFNSYHNVILSNIEYERGRVYAFDDAIEVVKDGGKDGNSKDNSSPKWVFS